MLAIIRPGFWLARSAVGSRARASSYSWWARWAWNAISAVKRSE